LLHGFRLVVEQPSRQGWTKHRINRLPAITTILRLRGWVAAD